MRSATDTMPHRGSFTEQVILLDKFLSIVPPLLKIVLAGKDGFLAVVKDVVDSSLPITRNTVEVAAKDDLVKGRGRGKCRCRKSAEE